MAVQTQAQVPGPKSGSPMGFMKEVQSDFLGFLIKTGKQFPDVFTFRVGPVRMNVVTHPDYLHQILVAEADKFYKQKTSKSLVRKFLGDDAMVILDGDHHKRQRRLVTPAFHSKRIDSYAASMVELSERLMSRWPDGRAIDFDKEMSNLAMAIVAKTMFDADVLDNPDNVAEALTTFADLMSKNAFGGMQLPDWVPTEANREKKRALTLVDGIVADIVARRRTEGRDRGDLLSMLILTQDEDNNTLTDQQILDQTKSLFFAGHETTAKALTWTFYLLAQNPEAESRLHAEVDEVLGAGPNGRRAGADDFAKLVYTQRVIREAMRLYPPAWILDREPQTDVVIGGHTFKKGSKIFFSPYLTHRDARWWPDPERFDPDRFTPEQEASRHKHAYVPFGGGPRVCIGQIFAMMEATLATATIAQRVRLALAPGQVIEPAASSTLYPKNGLKLIPSAR